GTTNTKSTYFIYSEQGLLGETDQDGTLTKAYGFNPVAADQGLWSTDPIWQASIHNGSLTDARTEMHYLHTDHLGTPILATTKAGQTSWQAQAEAFGAAGILPGNRIRMNLRLPGQYFDGETGLHYNYFRDYDPSLGRYIQSDPIGLDGGLNTYGYAYQSSLIYTDPTGEAAIAIPGIAIGLGAAAIYCIATNCGQDFVDAFDGVGGMFATPGNVADTQISQDYGEAASDARQCGGEPPDRCKWLEENKHRYRADQVKSTQKAWGCRRRRRQ
ncbi:MAG: RHS repeat-associated core domain-containing protein, partial [Parahaliea sp.]